MPQRTKIIATLGPGTDTPDILAQMIDAGLNVARCNLSHGTHDDHRRRLQLLRDACADREAVVGVMFDLQGPKIRIGGFKNGVVTLKRQAIFTLDADCPEDGGDETRVGLSYPQLIVDVDVDDIVLLDDGRLRLQVIAKNSRQAECRVVEGGELSNRKGINKLGGGLSAPALTEKDKADILFAAECDVDYLAVSFPRNAGDIHLARQLAHDAGATQVGIVAKIERAEALTVLDEIIDASDAVMIARGDLGVEIGDPQLPAWQKDIIHRARCRNTVVITATQMMETMTHSPVPTRAEVFDVANAVIDGTDAVMLSGETSVGEYPVAVVRKVREVCLQSEKHRRATLSQHRISERFTTTEETIAFSAMYAANHFAVQLIASFTESGTTPLLMSRISSGVTICALSANERTLRRVTLYRGVIPVRFDFSDHHVVGDKVYDAILSILHRRAMIHDGDNILVTRGDARATGGTNTLKLIRV